MTRPAMPATNTSSATSRPEPADGPMIGPDAASRTRTARHYHVVMLALALVVLLVALVLEVRDETRLALFGRVLPELCVWRQLLAMDCPGCGLTRCFVSLAHADIARAWQFHPAGVVLFAAVLFQFPYRGLQLWRLSQGREQRSYRPLAIAPLLLVPLLIASWLWQLLS